MLSLEQNSSEKIIKNVLNNLPYESEISIKDNNNNVKRKAYFFGV